MSLRDPDVDKVMEKWEEGLIFRSTWAGVIAAKNPCDAWIYQEIIFAQKPDIIIEAGSWKGGGAMFLATMLDMVGAGKVISIDNDDLPKPKHERITWVTGDSTDNNLFADVKRVCKNKRVMVILDSDHHKENVYNELKLYSPLVGKGMYLIVEDTWWEPDTIGPWQAVKKFLEEGQPFEIDKNCERYLLTHNPNGFLKKHATA